MSDVKTEDKPVTTEQTNTEGTAVTTTAAPVSEPTVVTPEPSAVTEVVVLATEAPDVTEEPKEVKKEEEAAPAPEPKTITEGWLEFKPSGFLHFIPSRRYFFFQDEPVIVENLQSYLKKDKTSSAHSNAAFATQTGKGLLFFAKGADQKAHPVGIIRLADVSDVIANGALKFSLKTSVDALHFEAATGTDREGWVHTIKGKVVEAKEGLETVVSSEAYLAALAQLSKPPAPASKSVAPKEKEVKESRDRDDEDKKSEKKDKEEEKEKEEKKEKVKSDGESTSSNSSDGEGPSDKGKTKKTKRSNSRKGKRTSFLSGIATFKDKKHDKEKKDKEEKIDEKKEEEKIEDDKAHPTPVAPTTEEIHKATEETRSPEEPAKADPPAEQSAPKKANRNSVFGFISKSLGEKKETEKEPTKDKEIAPVEESKEPAAVDVPKTEAPKAEESASSPPADTGIKTPSSPPKESFFDKIFKPKDRTPAPAAIVTTEPKKEETVEPKTEEAPVTDTPKETPEEKPSEASSPKDPKRRSSFFPSLGKKEKKPDVKSDTEDVEPMPKSTPSSPLPKKLNLFRKNSKSAKDTPKEESKEEVPPVPEVPPDATTTPAATETTDPVAETSNAAIGDVVADAVTVGEPATPVHA